MKLKKPKANSHYQSLYELHDRAIKAQEAAGFKVIRQVDPQKNSK